MVVGNFPSDSVICMKFGLGGPVTGLLALVAVAFYVGNTKTCRVFSG